MMLVKAFGVHKRLRNGLTQEKQQLKNHELWGDISTQKGRRPHRCVSTKTKLKFKRRSGAFESATLRGRHRARVHMGGEENVSGKTRQRPPHNEGYFEETPRTY